MTSVAQVELNKLIYFLENKTTPEQDFENAWMKNDYIKMEELKNLLPDNQIVNYLIDISLEEGDEIMVKYLLRNYAAYPSLIARELASMKGHIKLV